MKKITLLIAMMLLVVTGSFAQAGLYTFAQSSGTYVPITGGTVITSTPDYATTSLDSYASGQLTLPTPFNFSGVYYTTFYVTSNGQIGLGTSAPSSTNYRVLSGSTGGNVFIAPFSADISAGATGSADIRWEQVGNEIVIQWRNFRRYLDAETFNFQARLNTVTKEIKFVYDGTPPFDAATNYQPQVGLKSATGAGNYIGLTVASGGSWATPTVITTGIADTSIATFTGSTGFTSGLTYTFTPPAGCGPAALAGGTAAPTAVQVCNGVVPGAITVTGASNATYAGVIYQWEESTNNGTSWANATGGTGANTSVYTPPAFAGSAIQYRLKVSCSGSDVYSNVSAVNPQVAPTTQATALTLGNAAPSTFTVSWTAGNGGRRLVYLSTSPITDPISGSAIPAYTAATAYTTGQQIVFDSSTGTSVTVTGLTCGTTYYVKIFDYNRCGAGPYDVYFNTTTGTNALTVINPTSVIPITNNFTGFTGSNLGVAVPGWYEATIATTAGNVPTTANPAGLTSSWTNSSSFTITTARINLVNNVKNEWVVGPKFNVTANARIKFKAAITDNGTATADAVRMTGSDDKVSLMISSDCGATWTALQTFDAASTTTLTNALQDFIVAIPAIYNGQTVQIAFQATDGPVDNTNDYDFHIGALTVELVPNCDKPVVTATTNITKNTATINWNIPAAGVPTGYQYVVSTSSTAPAGAGTPVTGTTANVTGLTPLTTYYVFVRTVCSADFSDWSLSGTFGTLCDYGSITGNTPASRCGAGNITLGAVASAGSTVQWFDAANGGNIVATGTTLNTSVNATTTFYATSATPGTGTASIGAATNLTGATDVLTAFNNRFTGYRMQIVYTAAELASAGLLPGNITSIAFNTTTLGDGATNTNFTVKMGALAGNTIPSTTFVTTGLNTVYGPVTHTHTASGWQVITLSAPYAWDGTSNIIVELAHNGANLTNSAVTYYTPTVGNTILYTTGITSTTGTLDNKRLDIMFAGQVACRSPRTSVVATVDAPPVLTLSGNPATICSGQSTAPVTITAGAANYNTYVWTPPTGVTGTAAAGWIFNPAVSTTYSLQASQTAGSLCNAVPVTINVTVNALPSPAISLPATASVCEQSTQALVLTNAVGAINATFGNGTTAPGVQAYPNPFSAYYGGTKTQILFTAEELMAQGLVPGSTISTLSFDFNTSAANALNDFRIKIGTTANQNTTGGFVLSTSLTTVYNATYTPTVGVTGLVPITLTTPYIWTGGNLVIELAHNQGNGGNGSGTTTNTTQTSFNSVYTGAKDNTTPAGLASYDALTTWSVSTASDLRPNVVFGFNPNNTVVWSPVTNLYTDAAATVAYSGQSVATVYTKPTADIAYTATISNPAGCPITRNVAVTMVITPAPAITAPTQEFCNAGTVANLLPSGANIKWYAGSTGGVALAPTAALASGPYYASQIVNGCESVTRSLVTVTVNVIPAPAVPNATPVYCNAATVADLLPNGADIKWYAGTTGGTALLSTDALVSGTPYYASQTVNGCEGLLRATVTPTVNVVAAPTVDNAAPTFCNAATVADLLPNGAEIKWYADTTGGIALLSTDVLVSGTPYYASQTIDGCEGLVRGTVTPTINVTAVPTGDDTQEFCDAATVADLTAEGDNIVWYDAETAGNVLAADAALADDVMYYASQTIDGCEGLTRFGVTAMIYTVVADAPENVSVCTEYVLPALVNGAYYTEANGQGTAIAAGTAITQTATIFVYNAEGIDITCSDENSFTVTVANIPAPTGDDTQTITTPIGTDVTIEDLQADVVTNGTITWYASEEDAVAGVNPLAADTVLTQGATYYATQTVDTCTSVDVFAVVVDIVLDRDGFDVKAFTYHPNPVQNVLNISYSSEITSVTVFNLLGQLVISQKENANDVKVDMSSLADGAYVVNVTAGATVKTIKVIKKQ